LLNVDSNYLYSSPNVTGEDEMGGTYDTTGREEHAYVLVGNLKETDHFEDLGVDGQRKLRVTSG